MVRIPSKKSLSFGCAEIDFLASEIAWSAGAFLSPFPDIAGEGPNYQVTWRHGYIDYLQSFSRDGVSLGSLSILAPVKRLSRISTRESYVVKNSSWKSPLSLSKESYQDLCDLFSSNGLIQYIPAPPVDAPHCIFGQ